MKRRAEVQTELRLPLYEKLAEQPLRFLESLVGQRHRFGFADRVRDEAFLMESVHGVPIEAFPCAAPLVQREVEKRQDRVVNLFRVDVHEPELRG
jgi:hypothetical protein